MTKKDIEKKAKEWIENNFMYWDFLTPGQKVFLENAFVEFAEKIIKSEPEIEYGKKLIRDILISMNGTYLPNISEDTKELLKEAAFYINVRIGG